jgi:hypothetical protein
VAPAHTHHPKLVPRRYSQFDRKQSSLDAAKDSANGRSFWVFWSSLELVHSGQPMRIARHGLEELQSMASTGKTKYDH